MKVVEDMERTAGGSAAAAPSLAADADGLAHVIVALWSRKLWLAGCTAIATAAGALYAMIAPPVYNSQAIIALKESGKGPDPSRIFSQLGGLGGMVASQLGAGGASLEKVEIILKGHELAETVIRKHDLMPMLFPERPASDSSARAGVPTGREPTIWDGIGMLRKRILGVSIDPKKKTITVGASFRDPQIAKNLVDWYLEELNNRMRNDVVVDAENNRQYLERQLSNTSDPVLMEKIHGMIAMEIEKYMLVSSRAFEVLESAVVPIKRAKPRRVRIVAISVILGLFGSVAGVFLSQALHDFKDAVRIASMAAREGAGTA